MISKRWKAVENSIAKMFGSTRTPLSGGNSKHTRSDTLDKRFFVELKHGESSMIKTMHKIHKKGYCTILESDNIDFVMVQYSDIINQVKYKVQKRYQHKFAVGTLYQETKKLAFDEMKVPLVMLHLKGNQLIETLVITEAEYMGEITDKLIFIWREKLSGLAQKSLLLLEKQKEGEL